MIYIAPIFIFIAIFAVKRIEQSKELESAVWSFIKKRYYVMPIKKGNGKKFLRLAKRYDAQNSAFAKDAQSLLRFFGISKFWKIESYLPKYRGFVRIKSVIMNVLTSSELLISNRLEKRLGEFLSESEANFLERALLPYVAMSALGEILYKKLYFFRKKSLNLDRNLQNSIYVQRAFELIKNRAFLTPEHKNFLKNKSIIIKNRVLYNTYCRGIVQKVGKFAPYLPEMTNQRDLGYPIKIDSEQIAVSFEKYGPSSLKVAGKNIINAPPSMHNCFLFKGKSAYPFHVIKDDLRHASYSSKLGKMIIKNLGDKLSINFLLLEDCYLDIAGIVSTDLNFSSLSDRSILFVEGEIELRLELSGAKIESLYIEKGEECVLHARFWLDERSEILLANLDASEHEYYPAEIYSYLAPRAPYPDRAQNVEEFFPESRKICGDFSVIFPNVTSYHTFTPILPRLFGENLGLKQSVRTQGSAINSTSISSCGKVVSEINEVFRFGGASERIREIKLRSNGLVVIPFRDNLRIKRGELFSGKDKISIFGCEKVCFSDKSIYVPQGRSVSIFHGLREEDEIKFYVRRKKIFPPFTIQCENTELINRLSTVWNNCFGIGTPKFVELLVLARLISYRSKSAVKRFLFFMQKNQCWESDEEYLALICLAFWYQEAFGGPCLIDLPRFLSKVAEIKRAEFCDRVLGMLFCTALHGYLGVADKSADKLEVVEILENAVKRYGFEYCDVLDFKRIWLYEFASKYANQKLVRIQDFSEVLEKFRKDYPPLISALLYINFVEDFVGVEMQNNSLKIGNYEPGIGNSTVRYVGCGASFTMSYRLGNDDGILLDGIKRNIKEIPFSAGKRRIDVFYSKNTDKTVQ